MQWRGPWARGAEKLKKKMHLLQLSAEKPAGRNNIYYCASLHK